MGVTQHLTLGQARMRVTNILPFTASLMALGLQHLGLQPATVDHADVDDGNQPGRWRAMDPRLSGTERTAAYCAYNRRGRWQCGDSTLAR